MESAQSPRRDPKGNLMASEDFDAVHGEVSDRQQIMLAVVLMHAEDHM